MQWKLSRKILIMLPQKKTKTSLQLLKETFSHQLTILLLLNFDMLFKLNNSSSLFLTTAQVRIYRSTFEIERYLMSQTLIFMLAKSCLRLNICIKITFWWEIWSQIMLWLIKTVMLKLLISDFQKLICKLDKLQIVFVVLMPIWLQK